MPNNVAEELSSKLPSQIGSVASTQLGLKYGNCVSHYRAVEIVLGELLKVRRGVRFTSDVLCGLMLTQQKKKKKKKAPWRGDSRKKREAKEGW